MIRTRSLSLCRGVSLVTYNEIRPSLTGGVSACWRASAASWRPRQWIWRRTDHWAAGGEGIWYTCSWSAKLVDRLHLISSSLSTFLGLEDMLMLVWWYHLLTMPLHYQFLRPNLDLNYRIWTSKPTSWLDLSVITRGNIFKRDSYSPLLCQKRCSTHSVMNWNWKDHHHNRFSVIWLGW